MISSFSEQEHGVRIWGMGRHVLEHIPVLFQQPGLLVEAVHINGRDPEIAWIIVIEVSEVYMSKGVVSRNDDPMDVD